MKPTKTSSTALVAFLLPFLPHLRGAPSSRAPIPDRVRAIWLKLEPYFEANAQLRHALLDVKNHAGDDDAVAAWRLQLRKLLAAQRNLDDEVASLLGPHNETAASSLQSLDKADETVKRLEMLRLLRLGVSPEKVARQFGTDLAFLFHLHASFSTNGVHGILPSATTRRWIDTLNREEPLLRRLEMVRLARVGVPLELIAAEFKAVIEYVQRISERFHKQGAVGLLTEDEFKRFRVLHPELIRISTFNLHGVHDGDEARFRPIARELSAFEPDVVAFQEAIDGAGIRETSNQVAQRMSSMAGFNYRTFFVLCHLYQEKYPEGVALCARHQFSKPQSIDLNENLRHGLSPTMPRFAAAFEVEIHGRRVAAASTHLDHGSDSAVREAQAEKLVAQLETLYPKASIYVIAGDFNDTDDSSVLEYFRTQGYIDAYRSCNAKGGNTFTTEDPQVRIDYIMIKGADQILSAQVALGNVHFSDHLGVFATFR